MPQINKNLFLGVIFGPYLVQWVLALISQFLQFFGNSSMAMVAGGIACVGLLFAIASAAMLAVLVFKLWETIQDGTPRTTPGKACGFLFIPLFNFYWLFVAFWGWAKDFNVYIEEKNVSTPRMVEGLALTLCIVVVSSILFALIPFFGLLVGLVNAALLFLFFTKAIDGANAVRVLQDPPVEPAA